MTTCSKCGGPNDTGNSRCDRCEKYYRDYYVRNNAVIKANRKARVQRNRDVVLEYLLAHPCVDCGESDPLVLQFDHVRGTKDKNVAVLVQQGLPVERLLAEIAKCDVRCANCHIRRTARQFNWLRVGS